MEYILEILAFLERPFSRVMLLDFKKHVTPLGFLLKLKF